jgi:hypothetical protein
VGIKYNSVVVSIYNCIFGGLMETRQETIQQLLRNVVTANAIRHEAADYIDGLEEEIEDLLQQVADLKLKNLVTKIDNSIAVEKQRAALMKPKSEWMPPVPSSVDLRAYNKEIRRQLGHDLINAERNGDDYES